MQACTCPPHSRTRRARTQASECQEHLVNIERYRRKSPRVNKHIYVYLCLTENVQESGEELVFRCEIFMPAHTLATRWHDPHPEQTGRVDRTKSLAHTAHLNWVNKAGALLWRCLCGDCQHDLETQPPPSKAHAHRHKHTPNTPMTSCV